MAKSEILAIPLTKPNVRLVRDPSSDSLKPHLSYDAEIQFKRKPKQVKLILCNSLDQITLGEPVMVSYHLGMKAYQHSRTISLSNSSNTFGGFYYTNGEPA